MTVKDLNNYRAELIEDPLSISLGDARLYAPSAPLSGPVLALILNILKGELSTTALQGAVLSDQAVKGNFSGELGRRHVGKERGGDQCSGGGAQRQWGLACPRHSMPELRL